MNARVRAITCGSVAGLGVALSCVPVYYIVQATSTHAYDLADCVGILVLPAVLVALLLVKPNGFLEGLYCAFGFTLPLTLGVSVLWLLARRSDDGGPALYLWRVPMIYFLLSLWLFGSRGFLRGSHPRDRAERPA